MCILLHVMREGYNILQMDKKLYFMRHATSQHNSEKTNFRTTKHQHQPKSHPEYQHIKFSKSLIDSHILNKEEIALTRQHIDLNTIELIFCSPLRRCLQTCSELVRGHEGKIHVKVLPYLNSRLSAAWSIGSSIDTLMDSFSDFDFSQFKGSESTWMLKLLLKQQQGNIQILQSLQRSSQEHLLQLLKNDKGESYHQFYVRINKLKSIILNYIREFDFKGEGSVLIISHSCVLNFLLGKEVDEKGKVKNKISFSHCVPQCFKLSEIELKPIKMSKL